MKVSKGKVYEAYMAVKDMEMGDMPVETLVKALANINKARAVREAVDKDREEAEKMIVTGEVKESGTRIERHNMAVRARGAGEAFDEKDILPVDELMSCAMRQTEAREKLDAYERAWREEEIEIDFEKIPAEDFARYVAGSVRREGERTTRMTQEQVANLYSLIVE